MISTPVFKAHLRVVPIPGEGVLLLAEQDAAILRGRAYERIVPLIDGRRRADAIVSAVADTVEPSAAWYALLRLERGGHVVERDAAHARADAAFWQALGADPAAVAGALGAAGVRVYAVGAGTRLAAPFGAALRQCGIAASVIGAPDAAAGGSRSDLDVVLTDDYLSPALPHFDAAARAARRRWLLLRPFGAELWLGPLFDPHRAGCLRCLQHRLGQRRPLHQLAARHVAAGAARAPVAGSSVTAQAACLLAAVEVARSLAGVGPDLGGVLWSIDVRERASRTHRLIANPACPVCGSGPPRAPAPLRLQSRPVAFDDEGGQRTTSPEAMLAAHRHLISPLLGVVGSFTLAAGADGVGRNYLADDVVGGRADTLAHVAPRFRGASAGKGISDLQARASALGEALERYSGQYRGTEVRIPGTFRELGERAIHPNRMAHYSERQYRDRAAWNRRHPARYFVPERFDPDARVDWTPVWSLTERRHALLPTQLLYYGPGWEPRDRQRRFATGDTNGCAAGNTLEEAVLQGFFEVVERDAAAIWWYNRLRRPAVDLDSFGDPWLAALAGRYAELDRGVVALDLTHDLGIPVFAGLSHLRGGEREGILIGFGCHFDPRIALQRALTEMCQMLTVDLDGDPALVAELGDGWLTWATRADQPYLVPDDTVPARTRADFPDRRYGDLLDGIEFGRERVEAHGMELLVLDQTRADVGMPAVKVLVPGLRHFWPRFAPGRLYDVPVALGWLAEPVAEAELNPVPFFW